MAHNGQGLAFVAAFEKRQPGLLPVKVNEDDDKNFCAALFVTLGLKPMVR